MDRTDLALCKMFLENSRIPIRQLGDRLGLSAAAVHGRIQALLNAGIIRAFTARLSLIGLRATSVFLWGTSLTASNEEILGRLKQDEHVYWVAFGGGGVLYVGMYLRSVAELDAAVASITKEAEILDPTVGILPLGEGLPEEPILDRLDARIVRALHRNARKSIADVAEELGISAKTAGRRLGRMIRDNRIELSMEWYPDVGNDVITVWHLDLRPTTNRNDAQARLMNRYGSNLLFTMLLSNLPRFVLAATWTGSMKELRDLQVRLGKEEAFARVVPNVLYTGYVFETWRDDLLMKWAGSRGPPA